MANFTTDQFYVTYHQSQQRRPTGANPCREAIKIIPMDFVLTSLLKKCSDAFVLIIEKLANLSFAKGKFAENFKQVQITSHLNKQGLDKDTPANYSLISCLNTISKIIEKLYLRHLKSHIQQQLGSSLFQTVYKAGHSTKTLLLKITSEDFDSIDGGYKSV